MNLSCSNCSYNNPDDAKFCQNCGNPLMLPCPECKTLNSAGVGFCKNCGHSLAEPTSSHQERRLQILKDSAPQLLQEKLRTSKDELDGERKPVTILFADIVGSTAIAEQLDPEEWKEIVSGAHQRMSEGIYRYEGTIAQLLGDGLLAFFGAPITHEDDPIRAVLAAMEIQDAILDYEHELTDVLDHFQVRIGINSGTVVIGDIGTDLHVEYLAIGDAVNVAARLQSSAQPGKVLLSENTARFVRTAFELVDRGVSQLKGKTTPINVFEVVRPRAVVESGRGIEGLHSPLIGRQREISKLQEAIAALRQGRGQIVALMGEAGIGKSRLVEEVRTFPPDQSLVEDLEGHPSAILWLEGRSLSYGAGLSFWPIAQLILSDLGLTDGDPEVRIKAALRRRTSELFAAESPEVLPFLFHLLGVRLSEEEQILIQRLDSETLKHQVVSTLSKYFERLADDMPTVLIIEDLHWADPSTIETIERLLPLTERVPLMILMVMRIDRDHGSFRIKMESESEFAHRFLELELKRLSSQDSDELVNQLLQIADFPSKTRELILSRSDGNPFYLEEIIRNLIDENVIVHQKDSWVAIKDINEVSIPETLQGVLLARIDRLEEQVRSTLQIASVIGKSFLYRLLEAISAAERELETQLSALQRADLVREKTRWPELEYMFKHSLTQEAAYESLLLERRKRFHLQVGEAIESLFPDRLEEFLGLLAHHFECAGEEEKALDYLLRAGDKARLDDTLIEATVYYQRALTVMDQNAQPSLAARTWLKLGLIHQMNFSFEAAQEANEAAFSIGSVPPDSSKIPKDVDDQRKQHPHVIKFSTRLRPNIVDPGKSFWIHEVFIVMNVFAGLAELDSETNVVPQVARSWEVVDGGKRYIFHLREDVHWTDGSLVTAADFEWSWKRNLAPETNSRAARLLDDVLGARAFRTGENSDPDTIGIRALDETTLEVRLERPVAYFIYLITQAITYPLPRTTIEQFGDEWWLPENIISNGAFQLTRFDESGIEFERNNSYFDVRHDSIDRVQWWFVPDEKDSISEYLEGKSDILWDIKPGRLPPDVPLDEIYLSTHDLGLIALVLNPSQPPLDEVRVRLAIVHALNRKKLLEAFGMPVRYNPRGGVIPLGLAGHSPELGYLHDLELAQQYLEEAGYPAGQEFPILEVATVRADPQVAAEFHRQLLDGLGIKTQTVKVKPADSSEIHSGPLMVVGWAADYPDPDNFLHKSNIYTNLKAAGWKNSKFEDLIKAAAVLQDRSKRLEMYRRADEILINDDVLVYPMAYSSGGAYADLIKPWVNNFKRNALGYPAMKDIRIKSKQE